MEADLTEFNDFKMVENPKVESYTFRGKDFVYWFNITLAEGRIYLSGDCGDNTFVLCIENDEMKEWLAKLGDIRYLFSESQQQKNL